MKTEQMEPIEKWASDYIRSLPERIQRLISCCKFDLYFGPYQEGEDFDGFSYPGFSKAIDEINKSLPCIPTELWADDWCILESEPEGYFDDDIGEWQEPMWEDWTKYECKQIKNMLFGSELSSYIG